MVSPARASRRGFTLMEFIVVLAVVAVMAVMAVPALMSIVPYAQLRGAARSVVSLMQQGRLLAGNSQKPARVSLDCRPVAGNLCTARLYTAVFNPDGTLKEWYEVAEASRGLARGVRAAAGGAAVTGNPDGLYWAVFLPSGQMRASHDPLRLIFSNPSAGARTWEVALNRSSGRATLAGLQ